MSKQPEMVIARNPRATRNNDTTLNLDNQMYQQPVTSLYYEVVVIRAPLQGLCYTVKDAVDWLSLPTARRFKKGSNHGPLPVC